MAHPDRLSVAMIGYGFMGAAHSQGWRVAPRFFDLPAQPSMDLVVGRNATAVAEAAEKWGWAESATDWREAIDRDDIAAFHSAYWRPSRATLVFSGDIAPEAAFALAEQAFGDWSDAAGAAE